jgi:hypothetical protein
MEWLAPLVMIALTLIWLALPARYDPAIRLREWLDRDR